MTDPAHLPAFALSGEIPELARGTDWVRTPLGDPADWPEALRLATDLCLASRFPMALFWGPQRVMLYNLGYAEIMGADKHPSGWARPVEEVWGEIWPEIRPLFEAVESTGEPEWLEDLPLRIRRAGRLEQTYFTFCYSALHSPDGRIEGVLDTVVETTPQILAARRLHTLSALGGEPDATHGAEVTCERAARVLDANRDDLPLAAVYLAGPDGREALVARAGDPAAAMALPSSLDPDAPPWAVHGADEVARGARVATLGVPACEVALLLELNGPVGHLGHLLVGINSLHPLDGVYREFLAALAIRIGDQVAAAVASAAERDASAALARERGVLAEVVAQAPAGMCLWWGPEHRFRLVNDRYRQIVPVGDAIGRTIAEVLPDVAAVAGPALDAVRTTGQPERYDELALPVAGPEAIDGHRYYSFDLTAVPNADGSPGGVLGVVIETTDAVRRRTELERELMGEREITEILQRSLLPPTLPEIPGAALAARYEAAGERFQVGGDFYDAFENGDGTWTLVVGDVQGKGAEAAALTAMARYTLRAEAAHGAQPGRLCAMLNDELQRHRAREAQFCTMVCATIAMRDGGARMRVAVAGHPAPLVLRSGRGPRVLPTTGPLVGILRDASWNDVAIPLGAGDAVIFYTDGVTEARAPNVILEPVDLAASLATSAGRSADQLVSRLAAGLPAAQELRDDYAILAFSLDP